MTDSYNGRIKIPEGRVGDIRIRHRKEPVGFNAPLVTLRAAILGGQRGGQVGSVEYRRATTWHELRDDDGIWMTDLPIEWQQHEECLKYVRGTVLVGGLGLGMALHTLAGRIGTGPDRVNRIFVVERSAEVVALVLKHTLRRTGLRLGENVEIITDDLFSFLRSYKERQDLYASTYGIRGPFDSAFYDIWRGDDEETFFTHVVPLRGLSVGVVASSPVCWNEDIMRGQLKHALYLAAFVSQPGTLSSPEMRSQVEARKEMLHTSDPSVDIRHNWSVPFFRWALGKKRKPADVMEAAGAYASLVLRHPEWETTWTGWLRTSGKEE